MPRAWSTRTGSFIDRKSNEQLYVVEKRVFYRANAKGDFQELAGDGTSVRFKSSPKPHVLTWNELRSELSCQNPDGTVQLFTRDFE